MEFIGCGNLVLPVLLKEPVATYSGSLSLDFSLDPGP